MENKNKFDTFDELDDFDKMLFEHYKNQDENIPLSTENAIKNAFNDKHKSNSTALIMFKKVAVFILAIGIITTTTVYAKDIVNFITNIFTNSNRGIDIAVDNGYVQNVDMDYIICNDIGVKVDYLLMDDKNLDISFVYKCFNNNINIKELKYSDFCIKDEENNIIIYRTHDKTVSNNVIGDSIYSNNEQKLIDNNTLRDSILITSRKFPNSQTLYIDFFEITFLINNEIKSIKGNWSFTIDLNNNIVTRNSYEYLSTKHPYVDNVKTSLTNSSLSIELQLNTLFNEANLYDRDSIILRDSNDITYKKLRMLSKNQEANSTITLFYPITIYDNIKKLYLHINLDTNKQIDLELSK